MKEKLLFITPHLSTGGLPQYLLTQINYFQKKYNISVIEIKNVTNDYVVQKNKIKELVTIYTLPENKEKILDIINDISPDIIHFQEIPEFDLPDSILDKIFIEDRPYNIFVTTHGSFTNPNDIRYQPDKYILVSEWSKKKFNSLNTPNTIWEYPVPKIKSNKLLAQEKLGFDPKFKHVLHVGLFTEGKNQGEIIEVAKLCANENILFHFVGNMAGNFEHYWKPLLTTLPANCIMHGEKDNTYDYYAAADLFYFPSKFELNPISLKEALAHNLKLITKDLETYEGYYDKRARYSTDNPIENKQILIDLLNENNDKKEDEITIVLAHCNNLSRQNLLQRCLSSIDTDIILSCNFPIDEQIQQSCDYVLYSQDNPILMASEYEKHNVIFNRWVLNPKTNQKDEYPMPFEHSYAVYKLIQQGLLLANGLNKKKIHIINYDVIPDKNTLINHYNILDNFDFKFYPNDDMGYRTNFFSGNINPMLQYFNLFQSKETFYENFKMFELKTYETLNAHNFKINDINIPTKTLFDLEGVHHFASYDVYQVDKTLAMPTIICHFIDGPFVEIKGGPNVKYDISFKDKKTNNIIYTSNIGRNNWARATKKYFIDWEISITQNNKTEIIPISFQNKRVYIAMDSKSLGDTIAWMPYIKEFKDKHNCHVITSTFWNELFEKTYPDIEFTTPGKVVHNIYAKYTLGWFYNPDMEPILPNTIPLQMAATNILGLEHKEIRPITHLEASPRPLKEKYITIATDSTAALKFWQYPNGWNELTEYLNKLNYTVVNVSKEGNNVKNALTPTNYNIQNVMNYIHHSEFFIGLASGLSWLSWALNKQTAVIGNFSDVNHEFKTNCIRIYNHNVCNSCWSNPNFKFDKGDWNWCPIHKDTPRQHECQKSITTQDVINEIKHLL